MDSEPEFIQGCGSAANRKISDWNRMRRLDLMSDRLFLLLTEEHRSLCDRLIVRTVRAERIKRKEK